MPVSVESFVELLWKKNNGDSLPKNRGDSPRCLKDLLHYGHIKGWLEDSDETFPYNPVDKRTAARIIHQFMKIEMGIKDLENVDSARQLQDLYTCRSCAPHIAQVFARGIMDAEDFPGQTIQSNPVKLFNHLEILSAPEIEDILNKVFLQKK